MKSHRLEEIMNSKKFMLIFLTSILLTQPSQTKANFPGPGAWLSVPLIVGSVVGGVAIAVGLGFGIAALAKSHTGRPAKKKIKKEKIKRLKCSRSRRRKSREKNQPLIEETVQA